MKYYKVLGKKGASIHGGSGQWHLPKGKRPGKWMPIIKDIELCERGYHVCTQDNLVKWIISDCEIWEVEVRGEQIDHAVLFRCSEGCWTKMDPCGDLVLDHALGDRARHGLR